MQDRDAAKTVAQLVQFPASLASLDKVNKTKLCFSSIYIMADRFYNMSLFLCRMKDINGSVTSPPGDRQTSVSVR